LRSAWNASLLVHVPAELLLGLCLLPFIFPGRGRPPGGVLVSTTSKLASFWSDVVVGLGGGPISALAAGVVEQPLGGARAPRGNTSVFR